jgi:hypothetical protein
MPAVAISKFRISLIWTETVPAMLARTAASGAPLAWLGLMGDYQQNFNALGAGAGPAEVELPWRRPMGERFWRRYFEGTHTGEVTGLQAWKRLTPFRGTLPCGISAAVPDVKMSFESYFAPHGIALLATAYYEGAEKSLPEVADIAHAVRFGPFFGRVGGAANRRLEPVAEDTLADLCHQAFGANIAGHLHDSKPFTVTTLLDGRNASDSDKIKAGSPEHRLLEAVTGWNPSYRNMNLKNLPPATASVRIKRQLDGDLMYARKNGRAIWLPRAFISGSRTLTCYHRNIVFASLQTQSLGGFSIWAAAQQKAGAPVDKSVLDRAKRATTLLGLLSEGNPAIYQSASVAKQIEEANYLTA